MSEDSPVDRKDEPYVFGQRHLTDDDAVWDHNAWDHVELDDEQMKLAEEKIATQKENPVTEFNKNLYNKNPARYWDLFYKNNENKFFKDRRWLKIEFPALFNATKPDAGPITIFEIGCGAGNTLFPILSENNNPDLKIIGADYSPRAVQIVKEHELFDPKHASAHVWDLANPDLTLPEGVAPHSIDIIVLVFVFSALSPNEWEHAINNMALLCKPGAQILLRDYGRYDMAQLRFKKNRLLDESFYVRGDGTRVYFFTEEELAQIFSKFTIGKIATDRRLMVNRQRKLKMYRNWVQAQFFAN
ncbi:hypothetical protein CANCADRAFT_1418 [Tortispora caseinolytica NRRL Y-17796]|uniref:tRNA N(3)-methylcytidine methyltransferase n=1 Tax=Tortispora caseinolytica NRRL Y-17796 TaxID=767744 RepID=A0A1E4TM58_9ASCO|nr:hypothetical protein CANCADRAFT_1418 [Tortispora caseinolytica NRRL Y-17796]